MRLGTSFSYGHLQAYGTSQTAVHFGQTPVDEGIPQAEPQPKKPQDTPAVDKPKAKSMWRWAWPTVVVVLATLNLLQARHTLSKSTDKPTPSKPTANLVQDQAGAAVSDAKEVVTLEDGTVKTEVTQRAESGGKIVTTSLKEPSGDVRTERVEYGEDGKRLSSVMDFENANFKQHKETQYFANGGESVIRDKTQMTNGNYYETTREYTPEGRLYSSQSVSKTADRGIEIVKQENSRVRSNVWTTRYHQSTKEMKHEVFEHVPDGEAQSGESAREIKQLVLRVTQKYQASPVESFSPEQVDFAAFSPSLGKYPDLKGQDSQQAKPLEHLWESFQGGRPQRTNLMKYSPDTGQITEQVTSTWSPNVETGRVHYSQEKTTYGPDKKSFTERTRAETSSNGGIIYMEDTATKSSTSSHWFGIRKQYDSRGYHLIERSNYKEYSLGRYKDGKISKEESIQRYSSFGKDPIQTETRTHYWDGRVETTATSAQK